MMAAKDNKIESMTVMRISTGTDEKFSKIICSMA